MFHDYFLIATLLLGVGFLLTLCLRDPAKRVLVVRSLFVLLLILPGLLAVPGRQQFSTSRDLWSRTERPAPVLITVSNAETLRPPVGGTVSGSLSVGGHKVPVLISTPSIEGQRQPSGDTVPGSWLRGVSLLGFIQTCAMFFVAIWQLVGFYGTRRLLRESVPFDGRVRKHPKLAAPIILGLFRPTILIPATDDADEIRYAIAHETAHRRNGDLFGLALERLLMFPLCLNPLFWLLRKIVRRDQETLADLGAVETADRTDYAAQLLVWARRTLERPLPTGALVLGITEQNCSPRLSRNPFSRRITMLLDDTVKLSRPTLRWRLATVALLTLLALGAATITLQPISHATEPGVSAPGVFESLSTVVPPGATASTPTPPALALARSSLRAEQEILEKLEEPFSCDFKESVPLGKALQYIREKKGIEIFVDHPALMEIDVTTSSPVKFQLTFGISLRDALDYLLKQHGLAWIVKNEMLNITTQDRVKGEFYSKVYYIGDLLAGPTSPFSPPKQLTPHEAIDALGNQTSWPATKSDVPKPPPEVKDLSERFRSIMNYITTMVAPKSWNAGGQIMEYYPNLSLVVRQKEEQHEEIVRLLHRLREFNAIQICFKFERLEAKGFGNGPRVVCFNGMEGMVSGLDNDTLVRVAPESSKPVPAKYAALNKPFMVRVPEGKSITVKGIAGTREGEDIIKMTLTVEGEQPETRTFYASPLIVKDEELPVIQPASNVVYSQTPSFVEHNLKIRQKLEMPVLLNIDNPKPLVDVLQIIHKQTGVEFRVDDSALRKIDITTETPVAITLMKEIKLKSVLQLILGQLGLGYVVQTDVLYITSAAKAKDFLITKTYFVGGLTMSTKEGNDGEELIELIKAVVLPDSWQEGGTATYDKKGNLTVVQTEEVHAEIPELLAKLREMNDLQIGFLIDSAPFDTMQRDKDGEIQWERQSVKAFNGQNADVKLDVTKKHLVRIQADSADKLQPSVVAKNEPIYCMVPAGKKLSVSGVASTDRQHVRVSVEVDKESQQVRSFAATPFGNTMK